MTEREAKPPWSAVPRSVRDEAERILGARVVRAVRAYGGYGPSATFHLHLADGRRAFFKGTYPLPPDSAVEWNLEDEELVYQRLGEYISPWAPAYFGSIRGDGWHALLLEDVVGTKALPWTRSKAQRAATSFTEFLASTHGADLPAWLSRRQHRRFGRFWAGIAQDSERLDNLATVAGEARQEAEAWLDRSLAALCNAEKELVDAPEPYCLMHFDARSDNVRLEGSLLRLFDWPFTCVGPHEFEVVGFVQSIEAEGGPPSGEVVAWCTDVLPLRPTLFAASVAGTSGYFASRAPLAPVAGLPRLRSIQRRQLKASLRWAAEVLELPPPAWLGAVPD